MIISIARQTMVSLSDVMVSSRATATARRLVRGGFKAEALQESHEIGPGGRDGRGVAHHLQEPAVPLTHGARRAEAGLGGAIAREVVDRDGPSLGRDAFPRCAHRTLVERREPDLATPAVHV